MEKVALRHQISDQSAEKAQHNFEKRHICVGTKLWAKIHHMHQNVKICAISTKRTTKEIDDTTWTAYK